MIVFVLPSFVAIYAYFFEYYDGATTAWSIFLGLPGLAGVELLLIAYLAVKIYKYADFTAGK